MFLHSYQPLRPSQIGNNDPSRKFHHKHDFSNEKLNKLILTPQEIAEKLQPSHSFLNNVLLDLRLFYCV